MRFSNDDVRPNTPRPIALAGQMVQAGQDARWRGVTALRVVIDSTVHHETVVRDRL